uniref:Uncharacterized protein n=1 Tax=Caenorhabditis japonica TaxID=281687 RepID=A0A8R1IZH6_CAEJA
MELIKFLRNNISQVLKMISKIQVGFVFKLKKNHTFVAAWSPDYEESLKMVVYKGAVQLSGKPNLIRFCHGKLVELDKVPNMKFHI